jgi:hypothetical protein
MHVITVQKRSLKTNPPQLRRAGLIPGSIVLRIRAHPTGQTHTARQAAG